MTVKHYIPHVDKLKGFKGHSKVYYVIYFERVWQTLSDILNQCSFRICPQILLEPWSFVCERGKAISTMVIALLIILFNINNHNNQNKTKTE